MITILGVIFILSAAFLAFTKPKLLYYIMVFFAGWYSLFIDVGLAVTIYRLIAVIFLLCLPIYLSIRRSTIKLPPGLKYLVIFVWYAMLVTVVARLFTPEIYIKSFFRGEGRWIFQIFMLFIDITPAILPMLFFKKIEDIKTAAKVFIGSTIVLSIFGWLQVLVYYLYKINIFPIFREGLTGGDKQSVAIPMFGRIIYRMHSLGGEPKDLAVTLAAAIILLIIFRIIIPQRGRLKDFLIGFFLLTLTMTLSTSGFYILVAGLILASITLFFVVKQRIKFFFRPICISLIILSLFFGFVLIREGLSLGFFKKVFLVRTVKRFPIEVFDAATLKFLFAHPLYGVFGVGMGNVHLYAVNYLWPTWEGYRAVFIPNSGYLEIISEVGVVGFVLFLLSYLTPIKWSLKRLRCLRDDNFKKTGLILTYFTLFVLIVYLMKANHINYAYLFLGLLYYFNIQTLGQKDVKYNNKYANRN